MDISSVAGKVAFNILNYFLSHFRVPTCLSKKWKSLVMISVLMVNMH